MKKNKILLTSIFSFALFTISCSPIKVNRQADVNKYLESITADELKTHLYIVASDENEGRDTGSDGQKKQENI